MRKKREKKKKKKKKEAHQKKNKHTASVLRNLLSHMRRKRFWFRSRISRSPTLIRLSSSHKIISTIELFSVFSLFCASGGVGDTAIFFVKFLIFFGKLRDINFWFGGGALRLGFFGRHGFWSSVKGWEGWWKGSNNREKKS